MTNAAPRDTFLDGSRMRCLQNGCVLLMRVAILAGLGLAAGPVAPASAQERDLTAVWSWVDAYYADYSAMSAAPSGPAMEKWLARYAPYAYFEDPTGAFFADSPNGISVIGRDEIRAAYLPAFSGPMGPVRWTIQRRVANGDWVAVEGWVDVPQRGKPTRTRFTTWLKIHDGQIVHQIDFMDYTGIQRQVAGEEPVPTGAPEPLRSIRTPNGTERALRTSAEFYQRYERVPLLAPEAGIAQYLAHLTPDYRLEDPTGQLDLDSLDKVRTILQEALAPGKFGTFHWEVSRTLTDGEWVAVEGSLRGLYNGRPFSTRFTTWLQVRGDKVARQIDYLDYATFRRMTSSPEAP
jgi:ketosteroid isomerase-like protein